MHKPRHIMCGAILYKDDYISFSSLLSSSSLGVRMISIRRFLLLPSAVSFGAIGANSLRPAVVGYRATACIGYIIGMAFYKYRYVRIISKYFGYFFHCLTPFGTYGP
jgi:hypothetical protein